MSLDSLVEWLVVPSVGLAGRTQIALECEDESLEMEAKDALDKYYAMQNKEIIFIPLTFVVQQRSNFQVGALMIPGDNV